MKEQVIDEIAAIARHMHRLVDEPVSTDAEAIRVLELSRLVMRTLREIYEPTPEQVGRLKARLNDVYAEALARVDAGDPSSGAVH